MASLPIGHRIRAQRKAKGLTQTALAQSLGISVSYINLIEHDKRSIGGALLNRLTEALDLELSTLDGAQERRMLDALEQIAADPGIGDGQLKPESARDLIARHEPWAKTLLTLRRANTRDQSLIAALSDRLNHDPLLNSSVHDMLSSAAAIRSVADIYAEAPDIDSAQRQRFDAILQEEAARLSNVAQTLASVFEKSDNDISGLNATEEVDDFLYARSNHFPALETFVESLNLNEATVSTLATRLEDKHGIAIRRIPATSMPSDTMRTSAFDPETNILNIAEGITAGTERFEIARKISLIEAADIIDAEIADAPELASDTGRERARRALAAYAAAAIVMPYNVFFETTEALRYDIDALAVKFGTSAEQLCHRFTTLRRPGAEGVPFAMLRANAAGYLTKRFPLPRLPMPRFGGACPLWAVYGAMQTPDLRVSQVAEFPNKDRFFFIARATRPLASAHGRTRPSYALMLACEIIHADRLVYSDGLNLSASSIAHPVGSTCLLCTRTACAHRQEASIRMRME